MGSNEYVNNTYYTSKEVATSYHFLRAARGAGGGGAATPLWLCGCVVTVTTTTTVPHWHCSRSVLWFFLALVVAHRPPAVY